LVSVAVHAGRLLRGVPVMRTQVPAALQAMHWPVQAEVQQMPSAQKPDSHSVAAVQVRPSAPAGQVNLCRSLPVQTIPKGGAEDRRSEHTRIN
jgi:hypothetical protein